MPEPPVDRYFDTCTLSNFALAGRLDLLTNRYGVQALVTGQVLDEVLEGIVAGYPLQPIEEAVQRARLGSARPMSADERASYRELLSVLAPGQASCVTLAQGRGGIVVTDDRAARGCCAEAGVGVTGTIGILKACVLDGSLAPGEADSILKDMIDAGFHAPVNRISSLV